jgi:hypothetical protein
VVIHGAGNWHQSIEINDYFFEVHGPLKARLLHYPRKLWALEPPAWGENMHTITSASSIAASAYIRPKQASTAATAPDTTASPSSSATNGGDTGIQTADFPSMSKKDLFNWMNGQIKAGKMSLDDSSAFLGMSMDMPVDGSQMTSSTYDTKKVNFYDVVKQGLDGANSRNDASTKAMLEKAVETMKSNQGSVTRLNITV